MSRVEPLQSPYDAEIQAQFDDIMRGAPPLTLARVLAAHPRAWSKFRNAGLLDRGPLSLREREITINRTCALTGCEYEWGVHITIFAEAAKLSDVEIRATVDGAADAACWTSDERALIAAVDALHQRATLSEAEFGDLRACYSEAQILEVMLLCGFYRTVSYIANGLALPLEPNGARFPQ